MTQSESNSEFESSFENRFEELWTDYLEGELNESGLVELQELLAAQPELLKQATDLYRTHRLLGFIATDQKNNDDHFVQDLMGKLPKQSDKFTHQVMQKLLSVTSVSENSESNRLPEKLRRLVFQSGWGVVALMLFAFPLVWYAASSQSNNQAVPVIAELPTSDSTISKSVTEEKTPVGGVRFESLAHAQFFGELPPRSHSIAFQKREYVLVSGLVELAYPNGASTIIEGPAVFKVLSDECLALNVGSCSVHAPEGAEGFRVETPVTHVVDRGTRFSINVTEASETEVHVIEGAADVYRPSSSKPGETNEDSSSEMVFEVRLTGQQASRFSNDEKAAGEKTEFNANAYHSRLPDRIVSYVATSGPDGHAELLTHVVVQRNGIVIDYPIEKIIPVKLTYFKAGTGLNISGHIAGGPDISELRRSALSDTALNTGVINPGGSLEPLLVDPVMSSDPEKENLNTSGMAVEFDFPVINGPGPEIVLFELQTLSNPPSGDAFHVSPLKFAPGLRSHTIKNYDLRLESPESLRVSQFHLYRFGRSVSSLDQLMHLQEEQQSVRIGFRVIAVGIDLSDLGYQLGEKVTGLFIQDSAEDDAIVDPVFIGGLPALE